MKEMLIGAANQRTNIRTEMTSSHEVCEFSSKLHRLTLCCKQLANTFANKYLQVKHCNDVRYVRPCVSVRVLICLIDDSNIETLRLK